MEFEKVKSYLSQQVDDSGISIYSHMASISRKIVEEKPENAYKLFENISLQVKQSKLSIDDNNIPKITVNEQERQQLQTNIDALLASYGRKPDKKVQQNKNDDDEEADEKEEENEEVIDVNKCANILEYQSLLRWCGISFDYEEAYQLQQASTRLVRKYKTIENSRFWGKIHAINNDYYIVECKLSEYAEANEDDPPKKENPGKGCNEFVYFVTTDLENGDWRKLNDVTPQQIKKSCQMTRLFTGDLDAKVGGRVYFEWNEAELLRAQIARISSATVICPQGLYQKPEEEDEENPFTVELNDEFTPDEEGGATEQSWVHQRAHLRKEGRLQKWVEPEKDEEEDEEKEEKEATEEELEEEIPILQSIANDTSTIFANGAEDEESESSNCWFIRQLNRNMPYKIVVINNKIWNGAKTVYVSGSKTFVNIYVGDGMKYNGVYYTPAPPAAIQSQFDEFKEIQVANENEEDEEETVTKKVSIFSVQPEEMPPPAKEEENEDENANDEDDDTQDVE